MTYYFRILKTRMIPRPLFSPLNAAWQNGFAKHGQRWAKHQRFTILHHHCSYTSPRRKTRGLWTSVERDGAGKNTGRNWNQRWRPCEGKVFLVLKQIFTSDARLYYSYVFIILNIKYNVECLNLTWVCLELLKVVRN